MTEKLYAERDPMQQDKEGNYYCKHVSAMTDEDLHSKSAIASELAHRDIQINILSERNKLLKDKQERWVSQMAHKENRATKYELQATLISRENATLEDLNAGLREQLLVFTEMDTKGAEFGMYILAMFQQHDLLVKENRGLRVAMDFLLRCKEGLIPSEADEYYDPERATFQQDISIPEKAYKDERQATDVIGG